jgi:Putative DNA-binding domain
MPTLLEIQRAVYRSLVEHDDEPAAEHIVPDALAPAARLSIYRNTFLSGLTTALRLSYPAVHRLVGAEFFEATARSFIETQPPRSAYLDEYGAGFPEFLASFAPAASLVYLAGVARLEWAVSRALHARDVQPLDLSRLSVIDPADQGRVVFVPHPSVGLVRADHPVDAIWRAVLAQDDAAMAAIDLGAGPARLLVHRAETGVDVKSMSGPAYRFMAELCASRPLQAAIDAAPGVDATISLAEHLAAGRFVDFQRIDSGDTPRLEKVPA